RERDPGEGKGMRSLGPKEHGRDDRESDRSDSRQGAFARSAVPHPQGFRRAQRQNHVDKREPAKTPAKDIRAWEHRNDKDENEQTKFPLDWPNESSTETDQTS